MGLPAGIGWQSNQFRNKNTGNEDIGTGFFQPALLCAMQRSPVPWPLARLSNGVLPLAGYRTFATKSVVVALRLKW